MVKDIRPDVGGIFRVHRCHSKSIISFYMTFGYPDFAANLTETKNLYAKSYRVSIRIADIHSVQYAKTFVKFIH
jgi:hypothetical protein